MQIDFQVTDEISEFVDQLLAAGQNRNLIAEETGEAWLQTTLDRFRDEETPAGVPWKPSARAAQQGGRTLTDSSRLSDSITVRTSAHGVEIGTNLSYAAIHQFGGKIEPKDASRLVFRGIDGNLVFAGSVTIPARPYIGFGAQDQAAITDALTDYLEAL